MIFGGKTVFFGTSRNRLSACVSFLDVKGKEKNSEAAKIGSASTAENSVPEYLRRKSWCYEDEENMHYGLRRF